MRSEGSPIPPSEKSKLPKQYLREARRTLEEIPDVLERTINGTAQALRFLIDACIPVEKQSLTVENVVDIGGEYPALPLFLATCIGILATIPLGGGTYAAVHPEKVRELSNAAQDAQARVQDLKQNVERVIQERAEDREKQKLYDAQFARAELNRKTYPEDYLAFQNFLQSEQDKETFFSSKSLGNATYWHEMFVYGESVDRLNEGNQVIDRISVKIHDFIKVFNEKNGRLPTWVEIYNAVIGKYMGIQDNNQASAYILALTGFGNCEARAKLVALIMERAFPEANVLKNLGIDLYGHYRDKDGKRHNPHIEARLLEDIDKKAYTFGGRRVTEKPAFESTNYLAEDYFFKFMIATTPLLHPRTTGDAQPSSQENSADQGPQRQKLFSISRAISFSQYPPSPFYYSGNGGGLDPLEEDTEEGDLYAPYKEPTADERAYRKEQERKALHEKVLERVHIAEEEAKKSFSFEDPRFLAKLQKLLDADPLYQQAQEKYNQYINLQDSFSYSEQDELRNEALVTEQKEAEREVQEMREKLTAEYTEFLKDFDVDDNFPPIDWEKKIMYIPHNTRRGNILFDDKYDTRIRPFYEKLQLLDSEISSELVVTNEAGLVKIIKGGGWRTFDLSFVPSRENFTAYQNILSFTNIALFRNAAERYPDLRKFISLTTHNNKELLEYVEIIQKTPWEISDVTYTGDDTMNLSLIGKGVKIANNFSLGSYLGYSGKLDLTNSHIQKLSMETDLDGIATFIGTQEQRRLSPLHIILNAPEIQISISCMQPLVIEMRNDINLNISIPTIGSWAGYNGELGIPTITLVGASETMIKTLNLNINNPYSVAFFGDETMPLPEIKLPVEKMILPLSPACITPENTLTFSPKAQEKIRVFLISAIKLDPNINILIHAQEGSTITPQQIQAEMQRIFPEFKENFVAE